MTCPNLQYHELSTIFPLINGEDFCLMTKDIEINGQREPIVLFEGKILDGRNRYRACRELEIAPITVAYEGDDPLGMVLSLNMHRRQLTVAQRAIVAAELVKRKRELERQGDQEDQDAAVTLPGIDETAKALGLSPRSVSAALRVFKEGSEELCEAVKRGEVRVSAAEQLTKLDQDQQRAICEKGPRAIAKAAREIRSSAKPSSQKIMKAKPAQSPSVPQPEQHIAPNQGQRAEEDTAAPAVRKPTAQRMFELAEEGMYEGFDPESVAEEILCDLEDGLDTQTLLFAVEVALKLKERLATRQHRR